MLQGVAIVSLAGAAAVGVVGVVQVSAWLGVFISAGVFLVVAYNLELFGGAFHSDLWFAIAWGGFPAITGAFAQDGRLTVAAVLVAAACVALSAAQRTLSTPVRRLRRRVASVDGTITLQDGTAEPIGPEAIGAAPEAALKLLSLAMPLLAVGLVIASRWPDGQYPRRVRPASRHRLRRRRPVRARLDLGLGAKLARRGPGRATGSGSPRRRWPPARRRCWARSCC